MAVFRKNTTKPEVDADLIRDYTDIKPERMHLHRITPAEYDAVPRKLKSRKALLFCPAGAMLLLTGAFAVGSDISAVKDFINDEPKSGVMLFAALMVSTTLFLAALAAVIMKQDRYIGRDQLVSAGQVTRVEVIRGSRSSISHSYHTIALHGSRKITVIDDRSCLLSTGSTALIVKSRGNKYYLIEVPADVVDYTPEKDDFADEIASAAGGSPLEYSDYEKGKILKAGRHPLDSTELGYIPRNLLRANPFNYGAVSLIWAALTVGAVIMVVYLIKGFRDHNAYVFAPLIAGCLCELPLTLWVTSYVFKPPVAPGQVCFTDCIIVRTGSLLGKQTASLIVPESRLYVDDMTVKSEIVRNIPQNVPVRVYYHPFSQEILWVREL